MQNGCLSQKKQISAMIVDDSALARQVLTDILETDPAIKVTAVASDPFFAAEQLKNSVPDVLILDYKMPRMDGLTFLREIMTQHPIPVVMCSAFTLEGSAEALKALEYGAVDIIEKPQTGLKKHFEEAQILICDTVKAAAGVNLKTLSRPSIRIAPKLTADVILPKKAFTPKGFERKVIVVGASTGGTHALLEFLKDLPAHAPGVVIVQHMPGKFTAAFAQRLDSLCQIRVKEAAQGDRVQQGVALIAPGGRHLALKANSGGYFVEVMDGPLVCRHRPSVDVLFRSAAQVAGHNALGVIMTGMGDDGARGMKEMKEAGASTIAQDEASCVVFGMPKEAIKLGIVDKVLPLNRIAAEVTRVR